MIRLGICCRAVASNAEPKSALRLVRAFALEASHLVLTNATFNSPRWTPLNIFEEASQSEYLLPTSSKGQEGSVEELFTVAPAIFGSVSSLTDLVAASTGADAKTLFLSPRDS